jgi:hypothetical protein
MKEEIKLEVIKKLNILLEKYISNIENDLKDRWNLWEKDVSIPEQYEVIGAIMSRQITIASNFVNNSTIWNGHIAPLIMRSLIDNYINFAWILLNPVERSRQFIYYGLGQEKLSLEHYKSQFDPQNIPSEIKTLIEEKEQWISEQQYTFLTNVSFKSWSEKNVRQMAEEADCLDIYNFPYQQFSAVTHNMWNHLGRYNVLESNNPLHKFLKAPAIFAFTPDVHYVELTVKYVAKMFSKFDESFNHNAMRDSLNEFNNGFDKIFNEFSIEVSVDNKMG